MFSGIVEEIGVVKKIEKRSSFWTIIIEAKNTASLLHVGSSVAVNGVCLTVVKKSGYRLFVNAVRPTLEITNLKTARSGAKVNLERALGVDKNLEGHFVLGHIDCQVKIVSLVKQGDYYQLELECPSVYSELVIDKGSVALDGVSLTVAEAGKKSFWVNIIPFTFSHTIWQYRKRGNLVNAEFDYLAKITVQYLKKLRDKGS
ncbi:MAG: riboflavin synthase [Candidatus Omnitrophica bacterium]|nr:riboflavin synthase [Candidatus Omnitrophota bacterium]